MSFIITAIVSIIVTVNASIPISIINKKMLERISRRKSSFLVLRDEEIKFWI